MHSLHEKLRAGLELAIMLKGITNETSFEYWTLPLSNALAAMMGQIHDNDLAVFTKAYQRLRADSKDDRPASFLEHDSNSRCSWPSYHHCAFEIITIAADVAKDSIGDAAVDWQLFDGIKGLIPEFNANELSAWMKSEVAYLEEDKSELAILKLELEQLEAEWRNHQLIKGNTKQNFLFDDGRSKYERTRTIRKAIERLTSQKSKT